MDTTNIIEATFGDEDTVKTSPRYQYDTGQSICFADLDLPDTYEVQFSNSLTNGTSESVIATSDTVAIDDKWFTAGRNVYAWLYVPSGDDGNRTMKVATIPVVRRPSIVDPEATEEQSQTIAELINLMTNTLAQMQALVDEYESLRPTLDDDGYIDFH